MRERAPEIEIDGEMHGDRALDEELRLRILPSSGLEGQRAICWCAPNVDSGNIAYNLLKTAVGGNVAAGPSGWRQRAALHILTLQFHGTPHRKHDGACRGGREQLPLAVHAATGPEESGRQAGLFRPFSICCDDRLPPLHCNFSACFSRAWYIFRIQSADRG